MVLYFEYDKIGEHFNLLKQDFFFKSHHLPFSSLTSSKGKTL